MRAGRDRSGARPGVRNRLPWAPEKSEAKSFHEHLVPEFEASSTDPLHVFLLMKDIRGMLS